MHHAFDRRRALAALGGLALAPLARAQAFTPGQPIKVLIGVPAGGTQDVLTRAIAHEVRDSLGPLIIDNRSGAAGRIAAEAVKNAAPDGRTLLLGTASMMAMFPSAYRSLSYDPIKDFIPIVNAARFELALVVSKDVPANTLAEFITWARAQGDKLSFGSYGAGTPSHFLGEMLNRSAGLKMVHVPYRGSTPARQDVMGGQIPVYFDTVGGALQMQPGGRVKVLATSGEKRSPLMPDLPTFTEAGLKDVVATAWFAYYAPLKTPQPIVDKLRAEFTRAVNSREVRQQLLQNGMYPVGDGPEALLKTMREDTARWGGIMKAVNFQAND
ncbi:Bug family tripartite tricarboxylate transporter substrate binding protein [Variovorax ginsengisoli]|jgi:tripartite-type tricarboxylate transporter receptor subunit TctC|uniref:Tripartite tricarboxylate transporter substrate binding protein n=1 Tax=Variovorax ginsengisoli TaxID=363844 RepID=A0ABT8S5Y2_9BURK|nr:tripartite tricarboxylate transporter substrate binding protein [Variovorax ginsengisoli]MDN8614504.1 tripartite tricarboxylate transporter substrate binding protein [Variovorax ginsengisoli]MDO1533674.1 tripartite tricarboxylate transporter substrate binding protein [Variovorax ginsengisoli]